jgi:hypothetical protein
MGNHGKPCEFGARDARRGIDSNGIKNALG